MIDVKVNVGKEQADQLLKFEAAQGQIADKLIECANIAQEAGKGDYYKGIERLENLTAKAIKIRQLEITMLEGKLRQWEQRLF